MRRRAVFSVLAVAVLAGCTAGLPPPEDLPPPAATESVPAPWAGAAADAAFLALSLVGTPYAAGGSSPETGFDCSGLVAYVFARAAELRLPRTTRELAHTGAPVEPGELRPGDLVFYSTQPPAPSHVGIYLGESRFVHAPATGGTVRVEEMETAYWARRFAGARRPGP